uniref:Integrin alpha-2 domain-containing protein n=1 Tax=Panagrolaimus sp. ES5 TaxID=591445 RepID=A0AC34FFJ2_9BILA
MITALIRQGPNGSNFGFSVSPHLQSDQSMILVGAPRGESGQPGTKEAGSVYKCTLFGSEETRCDRIQVEYPLKNREDANKVPNKLSGRELHYLGKDSQLLGFTVQSTGLKNGGAIVCAPLIRFGNTSAFPEGVCYWLNNKLENIGIINTCNTLPKTDRQNEYAVCEQGFSAYIDKNVILTGAPGARKWTGGVFGRYYPTANNDAPGARKWTGGVFGRYYPTANNDGDPESILDTYDRWTMSFEGRKERGILQSLTSHDYLGYSVRYGKFGFLNETTSDNKVFTIVSGASRVNQIGAVVFLPFQSSYENQILGLYENKFRLDGIQVGSAFGFALEVLDLNDDGYDDLLVSAPYEFHHDKDVERGGAVYVYFSRGEKQRTIDDKVFHDPYILRGYGIHSQFGAAITKLGSINLDNFEDFAVGAPYANDGRDFAVGAPYANDGRGAVYIFHGSRFEDFKTQPSQIIEPDALTTYTGRLPLMTFGSSLASNVDLDSNGYNDLVVGAFGSDTAIVLRTRPIIDAMLDYEMETKHIQINAVCDRKARSCFKFTTKMKLIDKDNVGNGVQYLCELKIVPSGKGVKSRGLFKQTNKHEMQWNCGRKRDEEKSFDIIVPNNNEDWINPLTFNFTVSVKPTEKTNQLLPIINSERSKRSFIIDFDKECGDDNKCTTDLQLEAMLKNMTRNENGSFVSKVTQQDSITISFNVYNRGEKAYASTLYIYYNNDELDEPVLKADKGQFLDKEKVGDGVIAIKLGNPIKENDKRSFDLSFSLVRSKSERVSASLNFTAFVNSTSKEQNLENNKWEVDVRLIKEADLEVVGVSNPPIILFSGGESSPADEEDIGHQVIHQYTVTNRGPFYAKNVSVLRSFDLSFSLVRSKSERVSASLNFTAFVNSTSKEQNLENNKWEVDVRLIKEADLEVVGVSNPPIILFSGGESSPADEEDIGHQVIHQYTVTNRGPFYAKNVSVLIDWPLELNYTEGKYVYSRVEYGRTKREITEDSEVPEGVARSSFITPKNHNLSPKQINQHGENIDIYDVNCKDSTAICHRITCTIENIDADDSVLIEVRARLWNNTFSGTYTGIEYISISSSVQVSVDPKQGILESVTNNYALVTTHAYPDRPSQEQKIELWMIILAILAALLLLAALIFCCYKCGFFNRNRPTTSLLYQAQLRKEKDEYSSEA